MEKNIFERLQKFVVDASFVDDAPISRDTRLYNDLGISGDDASILFWLILRNLM